MPDPPFQLEPIDLGRRIRELLRGSRPSDQLQLTLSNPTPPTLSLTPAFRQPHFLIPASVAHLFLQSQQPASAMRPGTPTIPARPTTPPWTVPNPDPRPGELSNLLDAVLKVPEVQNLRTQLEQEGQRRLRQVWQDLRDHPEGFGVAVPAVVSVGVSGALLAYHLDAPLPKLPAIPFGDAVSLQLEYVNTVRGVLRDPLHPSSMGATLTLDLTRFFPALR